MSRNTIKEKYEFLKKIISIMPGNVYWKDRNGVFLGCNENLAKIHKLKSSEDIVGLDDYDLLTQEDADIVSQTDSYVMTLGEEKSLEEKGLNIDKEPAVYLTRKVPIFDHDNKVVGMVGISIDITDRKQVEQELRTAKTIAEQANLLKSQFIANMEHDIRTPAGGIAEMTKLLAENEKDSKRRESLLSVTRSAKQLLDLLNNILAFDHVESGSIPVLDKKLNIRDLIYEVIELEEPVAKLKELQLLVNFSDNLPDCLIGDEHRLRRILINLISNAIKFTEKGFVSLSAESLETKDDKICLLSLCVRDTGLGMSEEKQNLMYEKFSRGTPANQGLHKGMGLGLYIVKQFMEDMGGEIDVKTKVNKGTEFILTLPLRIPLSGRLCLTEEPKSVSEPEKKVVEAPNIEKENEQLRFLLVEDEPLAQMVASAMLTEDFNIAVDVAPNSEKAIELAKANHYDLIFMDIGLPGRNGIETAKIIRESKNKNTTTPIVALTAHNAKDAADPCLAAGMSDFLVKPLNSDKIEKMLDLWICVPEENAAKAKPRPLIDDEVNKLDDDVINMDLAVKTVGKVETAKALIKMMVDMIPEHKEEFRLLLEQQDYKAIGDLAHKIAGSTSYCGTIRLKAVLKGVEKAAKKPKKDQITDCIDKIFAEMDAVIDAYKIIAGLSG
ncbi:MAG: response regulator [Gammaproteobacteria bacterium]|nr:response regulator [Gammaproteobacteria bacterium]